MTQATAIPTRQQLFTRERVEAAIVYVSRILTDVVSMHDSIASIRRKMERVELGLDGYDAGALEADYTRVMDRLKALVAELDAAGVELIDFEVGIVLFPTVTAKGDGVFAWSLRQGGPPCLTKRELAHEVFSTAKPKLKGGVDA